MSSPPRKILVADADEIVVALISHLLHRQGYSVDIALNADEAAGRLASHLYDVILLDSRFARALRNAPQLAARTILLSPKAIDTDLPVHAILLKPIEFRSLIDTVSRCAKVSGE